MRPGARPCSCALSARRASGSWPCQCNEWFADIDADHTPIEALQRKCRRIQLTGHGQCDRELLVVAAGCEIDDLPLARDVRRLVANGKPLLDEDAEQPLVEPAREVQFVLAPR